MNIRIRLSAGLAQYAGTTRLTVQVPDDATVADVLAELQHTHSDLASRLDSAVPIVAGRHVSQTEVLEDGQEVAFLLPVAGG